MSQPKLKYVEKTARASEALVDQVEQKMRAWLENAVADIPIGACPVCTIDRDTLGQMLKQAYIAGVEAGITTLNSCSPFNGILHDAKEGLLIRN